MHVETVNNARLRLQRVVVKGACTTSRIRSQAKGQDELGLDDSSYDLQDPTDERL